MVVPEAIALDTSAAIPLLVRRHYAHAAVREAIDGRIARLTGHSLAETYAVLTRLPGDARLSPQDAARLIEANFAEPALVPDAVAAELPRTLARAGVAGGATYDALVAIAADSAGCELLTRDRRAIGTYLRLTARFRYLPDGSATGGT